MEPRVHEPLYNEDLDEIVKHMEKNPSPLALRFPEVTLYSTALFLI